MSVLFYFSLDHSKLTNAEHCGGGREPEQAVCQGLQLRMRSLYTHVPFLPRCRSPSFAIFSTVPPFVLLSQSHGVLSPSPACVEAFSLSHPPLIQRLVERRHFHKIHTVNIDNTVRTYCIIYAVNYKSKTNTKTVWQYKTFRAVYRLSVDFSCDIGNPTANFAYWLILVCCNLQSLSEFSCSCQSLIRCNFVSLSSEVSFPFFHVLFRCKVDAVKWLVFH